MDKSVFPFVCDGLNRTLIGSSFLEINSTFNENENYVALDFYSITYS